MQRYKQVFDNITIMNFHDMTKGGLIEDFYCHAMPDAKNICNKIKMSKNNNDIIKRNPSETIEYMNLLNAAEKRDYIKVTGTSDKKKYNIALQKVKQHQEETLELSSNDFVIKCPPPKVLEELLEKSLQFEKEIFPKFFSSPLGEAALRSDFEKKKTASKFCSIDSEAILETSEWREFFKSLNEELHKRK